MSSQTSARATSDQSACCDPLDGEGSALLSAMCGTADATSAGARPPVTARIQATEHRSRGVFRRNHRVAVAETSGGAGRHTTYDVLTSVQCRPAIGRVATRAVVWDARNGQPGSVRLLVGAAREQLEVLQPECCCRTCAGGSTLEIGACLGHAVDDPDDGRRRPGELM